MIRLAWVVGLLLLLPPGGAAQVIPGDINADGRVDFDDFFVLAANFGKSGPVPKANRLLGAYQFVSDEGSGLYVSGKPPEHVGVLILTGGLVLEVLWKATTPNSNDWIRYGSYAPLSLRLGTYSYTDSAMAVDPLIAGANGAFASRGNKDFLETYTYALLKSAGAETLRTELRNEIGTLRRTWLRVE